MKSVQGLFVFLVLTLTVIADRRKAKLHGRFNGARQRVTGRWKSFACIESLVLTPGKFTK